MKRLLLLISFTILFLYSFTQTDVQRDNRVNPVLKEALASKSGYYIYGRTGTARFINMAVLNQSSRTLCWFTCHGRLFDSTKLTVQEFERVTSKQLDPFVLYQNICNKYLADIAAAKDIYRVYGDVQQFDKLNGNYRALFAMETVQAAKTPLQKLIAIENVRKKMLTQLAYLNCGSPFGLKDNPLYKNSKEQAGAMMQTKDSTVYYNIDPTSAIAKISLYKKSAGQLYIQNRFSEVIDSVAIQPEKYDLLQKEKTDVFLLYRGWLEMQWQGVLAAIRRQSVGLYSRVNAQNEKEVKELYGQLNDIGAKINLLNSPEAKSIEQVVYDTYKSETSEIAYMPLLGIAYTLTQARGVKEYELTNHLGNVLATVTDKKIGVSSPSNSSLIDHYEPDIVSAQDYYPFGMLQPGRSYLSPNGDKYRYGFNDKENDNEVKGEGNQQDYGMRVYDPRLGRFLSVDPLSGSYPWNSTYAFAENDVLRSIDLDGLEKVITHFYRQEKDGKLTINKTDKITVLNNVSTPEIHKLEVNVGSTKLNNGKIFNINKTYSLNSEVTLKGRNEEGDLKTVPAIRNLSNDDLGRILAYSQVVFNEENTTKDWKDGLAWTLGTHRTTVARYQSVANGKNNGGYGLVDYKYVVYDLLGIDRSNLLQINGVIYDPNEAGNYLWGMVLTVQGTYGDPSEHAEAATWKGGKGRHDEPYDQKAISAGEQFGVDLNKVQNVDNTDEVKEAAKKYSSNGQAQRDYERLKQKQKKN